MSEPKPCPFCGGDAFLNVIEPHTHITPLASFMPDCDGGVFIECTRCTAAMSGKTEQEAIASWNTRAEPKARVLMVEELDDRIGKFVWIKSLRGNKIELFYLDRTYKAEGFNGFDYRFRQFATMTSIIRWRDKYGKTWLAYDCQPEGVLTIG